MNADQACELCAGVTWAELYFVDSYPIVRCRACGLVTVGRRDTLEDLVTLYGEPYWQVAGEVGYDDYLAAEARKRHHFRGLLQELERLTGPGHLLEVGSAYGFFLDEARKRGWRVRGVEPAEHAAHHARQVLGLDVVAGPLTELPVDSGAVDVVALWDVIERVPEPSARRFRARSTGCGPEASWRCGTTGASGASSPESTAGGTGACSLLHGINTSSRAGRCERCSRMSDSRSSERSAGTGTSQSIVRRGGHACRAASRQCSRAGRGE